MFEKMTILSIYQGCRNLNPYCAITVHHAGETETYSDLDFVPGAYINMIVGMFQINDSKSLEVWL